MSPVLSPHIPWPLPLRPPGPFDTLSEEPTDIHATFHLESTDSTPRSLSTSSFHASTVYDCSRIRESLVQCRTAVASPMPHSPASDGPSASPNRSGLVHDYSAADPQSAILVRAILTLRSQHKESAILSDVSYRTFASLSHFVDNSKFARKPKLTYLVKDKILMIGWPSRVHDAPAEDLAVLFGAYVGATQNQRFRVSANSQKIITKTIVAIPDLLVSISSMKAMFVKHLLVFECAFSQPAANLFEKVKKLAAALPDLRMVFLLQIFEKTKFQSPTLTSAAWQRFENDPSPLDLTQFLQMCKEEVQGETEESLPEEFMGAVAAGEHVWCNISHVKYYVWLRKADGKLEVNPESIEQTPWSAFGELPAVDDTSRSDLLHVSRVVNRGLQAIRAAILEAQRNVCEQIQIPVDSSLFSMPLALPETWDHFRSSLCEAKFRCAFERYQTWYLDSFRSGKHTLSDSDYMPSSSGSKLDESEPPQKRLALDQELDDLSPLTSLSSEFADADPRANGALPQSGFEA